ncbi:MAG TPA: hypothetical protein VFR07_12225 [Mycobacteriales bacterium]|nr:hypothetical protein [Mycobacteriales bacterium]
MPAGAYLLSGPDGPYAVERFSCGAGPAGWRYVARREQPGTGAPLGRLDVVLDARGRVLRAAVDAGGWQLRGGVVGPEVLWRRGDAEHSARAAGFSGTSPVWLLAATRLLGAGPDGRAATRLRWVRLGDEALATHLVDERWAGTPTGQAGVHRWEAADLATGVLRVCVVAGDLVLDAPGVALQDLPDTGVS